MTNTVTQRVRQHRERKGLMRVEVEVPTQDDALAVRRFAQSRRQIAKTPPRADQAACQEPASGSQIEDLLPQLGAAALEALRLFANALAATQNPAIHQRGLRIATNYLDLATTQKNTDQLMTGEGQ